MTRSDLIEKLAVEKNMSIAISEEIIHEMFGSMADNLIAGNRIEIRGFGSFEIRDYDGYTARNPKTGEAIEVKPKKTPFFKTGKELKDRIDAHQ
jgi:integration host factor subunit beta